MKVYVKGKGKEIDLTQRDLVGQGGRLDFHSSLNYKGRRGGKNDALVCEVWLALPQQGLGRGTTQESEWEEVLPLLFPVGKAQHHPNTPHTRSEPSEDLSGLREGFRVRREEEKPEGPPEEHVQVLSDDDWGSEEKDEVFGVQGREVHPLWILEVPRCPLFSSSRATLQDKHDLSLPSLLVGETSCRVGQVRSPLSQLSCRSTCGVE